MTFSITLKSALVPVMFGLLIACFGCGSTSAGASGAADAESRAQKDPIALGVGESLTLEDGSSLKFAELFDSRCPRGTHCITGGQAKVHLLWQRPDQDDHRFVLVLLPDDGRPNQQNQAGVGSSKVTLLAVEPYPDVARPSRREDRRATIEITAASGSGS